MFYKIRAKTEAKKNEVIKLNEDTFESSVKEKPEQGRANDLIIELLSKYLDIPAKRFKIIKGSKSPSKIIKLL